MKKHQPNEFLYSLFTLLAATIVVHGFWVAVVRPNAQAVLTAQAAAMKADPDYVPEGEHLYGSWSDPTTCRSGRCG